MKRKKYEKQMRLLHGELVAMQEWVKESGAKTNWLQIIPGKGFFTILRLYNPLPAFFDKTWQPSEIEPT